jgi:hypothetical protein
MSESEIQQFNTQNIQNSTPKIFKIQHPNVQLYPHFADTIAREEFCRREIRRKDVF